MQRGRVRIRESRALPLGAGAFAGQGFERGPKRQGFEWGPKRLLADSRGANYVEYIILVGVVALLTIAGWHYFGDAVRSKVVAQGETVANLGGPPGAPGQLAPGQPLPPGPPRSPVGNRGNSGAPKAGGGAPPPGGAAPRGGPAPPGSSRAIAEAITKTSGTATQADREAVLRELQKLPPEALQALQKGGYSVTVVRNSVVEALPALKGVQPRGWPPGATWDTVPGLYDPATKQVIIATRGGAVPAKGNGHGSENLVVHETAHAIDAATNGHNDPAFQAARNKDLAKLPAYETQPGAAGLEETYAESMARYYGKPASSQATNPELHKYWGTKPFK